jgi:hypothetical protein
MKQSTFTPPALPALICTTRPFDFSLAKLDFGHLTSSHRGHHPNRTLTGKLLPLRGALSVFVLPYNVMQGSPPTLKTRLIEETTAIILSKFHAL